MSFTTNIKNEILNIEYPESELIAELSAIININANIKKEEFTIYTENFGVARRIYKLIKDLFKTDVFIEKEKVNRLNKNYLIYINVKDKNNQLLKTLDIINEKNKIFYFF